MSDTSAPEFEQTEFPPETPKWRPLVHFTPNKNWMNDPNGMVYYNGQFHLFFQHNPKGHVWGNMSWGHAVSKDLIHWQELDVAILPEPEKLGFIFSGSTVVDWNNTSGLQQGEHPPLVALYTNHSSENVQMQSLAFSTDGGNRWEKYAGNPVIENPGEKDFRDPKVFWHEQSNKWIMVFAAGQVIKFYNSDDLINWSFLFDFGEDQGNHLGEWECPDLFSLPADDGEVKWVLLVSLNPGGPNGGSGTQYFIGDFDGHRFVAEHDDVRWLDFGPDNYAGVTWDGLQNIDNRRIYVGWMSNWNYAGELPTSPWRGGMTIPRELGLQKHGDEYLVSSWPAREIDSVLTHLDISKSEQSLSTYLSKDCAYSVDFTCEFNSEDKPLLTLENAQGETLTIKYLPRLDKIVMDRRKAGWDLKLWTMPLIEAQVQANNFNKDYAKKVSGRLIIDTSSIELFWHDGTTSMTANVFPTLPFNKLSFSTESSAEKTLTLHLIEGQHES